MAPEKKAGGASSSASDVYSLGLVMINVVALQRPATDEEGRRRGLARADVEDLMKNLVLRCVDEDKGRRPSAAELAMSLKLGQDYTQCIQEKAAGRQDSGDRSLAEVAQARERKDWHSGNRVACIVVNFDDKVKVAAAGAIPAILKAMQDHPSSPALLENACGALRNLAVNADNRVKIAAAGAIPAILKAMQDHPSSPALLEQACSALANLAANSDDKVTMAAAGAIPAILKAMQDHPSSPAIQERGLALLKTIG